MLKKRNTDIEIKNLLKRSQSIVLSVELTASLWSILKTTSNYCSCRYVSENVYNEGLREG